MNKLTRDKLIEKYNKDFEKHGVSQKSLGWNKGRSNLRFEVLTSQWCLQDSKILDFGCGFGSLFEYLQKKKLNLKYTGVDINPNFINVAKSKHRKAKFINIDIFQEPLFESFDYAFVSGTFNDKIHGNYKFIENSLNLFKQLNVKGIAFNCISDKVDFKEEHVFYSNPSRLLEICYKLSNKIILRNDYMPYEYSIFIFLNPEIDHEKSIYR